MRTALLAFALCATGISASAVSSLQRAATLSAPVNNPLAKVSLLDAREEVEPVMMNAPVFGNEDLSLDPKTLTYLCPDTFYPLSRYYTRAMNGEMDIMSGYDGDLLTRFKGNRIKTINLVVDADLKSVTVFVKNANFENVVEKELDLDALDPYMLDWSGTGNPEPWGKYAEVPVDYEIGDEPFYVGYHLEVSEDAEYGYFLMLAQANDAHDLCYVIDRYDGKDPVVLDGCVPFIWCDTEGEGGLLAHDVAMNGIVDYRSLCDEEYMVSGTLTNYGTEPVNNITFSYTGADGSLEQRTLESPDPLPYMTTITFNIPVKANAEGGVYEKLMEVADINGSPDELSNDNSTEYQLIAINNPADRVVLAEDYTGEWCGYCTRGMAGFDLLNEMYPDNVITTEYHVYDTLSVDVDGYMQMEGWVMGYPNAIVNHKYVGDPWSGLDGSLPFGMGSLVEEILAQPVETAIDAKAVYEGDSIVSVKTNLVTTIDVPDASAYEIGFTIIENGYMGVQSNSYSYENDYWPKEELPEAMWPYYDLPSTYPCEYDDVIRSGYGVLGNPGSVAEGPVAAGEQISSEISFPVHNIADFEKVSVVAYVMDASTKEVLNAVKTPLQRLNSVDKTEVGCSVVRTQDGVNVLADGLVEVEVFAADGSRVACGEGDGTVSVSLPAHGMYVVVVNGASARKAYKIMY